MEPTPRCMRQDLQRIHDELLAAADETARTLDQLGPTQSASRLQQELLSHVLRYVVRMDLKLAIVSRARQRLIDGQVKSASESN